METTLNLHAGVTYLWPIYRRGWSGSGWCIELIHWHVSCSQWFMLCCDVHVQRGNEALHVASLAGRLTAVQLLVEHGANVNSQAQVFTRILRSIISSICTVRPHSVWASHFEKMQVYVRAYVLDRIECLRCVLQIKQRDPLTPCAIPERFRSEVPSLGAICRSSGLQTFSRQSVHHHHRVARSSRSTAVSSTRC